MDEVDIDVSTTNGECCIVVAREREMIVCSSSDAEGELGSMTRISAVSLLGGLCCCDWL